MIIALLLILRMVPLANPCLQTVPGGTPATGITTTTTTFSPIDTTTTIDSSGCCPALTQTLTDTNFPDGVMTFTYNSDTCRTTASALCVNNDGNAGLYAAIIGNSENYLDYQQGQISVQLTCSGGTWTFTNEGQTLSINTLECVLTNPATKR